MGAGGVEAVRAEAVRIVVAMAPRAVAQPTPETRLVEDLGYDSLRLVELGIALEERFDVEVADPESFRAETLADVERIAVALLDQLAG
ncbi:MAG TPA: phosphopantetheine-binding protein [Conexibacter sp.]|nr:phosphopantetheine-binding protein [Conexibacter sp.]